MTRAAAIGSTVRRPALLALVVFSWAAGAVASDPTEPTDEQIRAAVIRSIPRIEASAATYRENRECFSCHHQALPVLMLTEARRRGFKIDEENYRAQLDHTAAHLERGLQSYVEGKGQGGKADTAGWALWTLEAGGRETDDTTAAVAEFLLTWQADQDHWTPPSRRPPTEFSPFTSTYVALRGLETFGTPEQEPRIAARRAAALQWLTETEPSDTEDRVSRLRSLAYLGAEDALVRTAADELIGRQLDDGGWSQTDELESDAYATGSVLAVLHEAGALAATDAAYRKGITWLLAFQQEDGSWKVATRSKPIQLYFESGFPHGKDQFISMSGSSWATTALLLALPLK